MDRTDRFINNRSPKILVLSFFVFLLLSAFGSWWFSGLLADRLIHEQIASMLAVSGGGSFLEAPDPQAIAEGEAIFHEFGVRTDMEPSLMPGYEQVRLQLFAVMLGGASLLCVVWLIISLLQVDRIYCQLEALRRECMTIAEALGGQASYRGEDFGCVRRICDSVNLLAKRMSYLSVSLRNEQTFLRDFLTDFSHQMKTSLAVVRLNSDMLSELEHLPPERRQLLTEEIMLHLDGMETLVISALRLGKLEAGGVVYERTETDLALTCRMAAQRLQPLLRKQQIRLELDDIRPVAFPHDPVWLCEAISNLLKNALDHGTCSTITMELSEIPGAVKLCITDNGKGIPQAEIPHLFDRFRKKSNHASMQNAGVGLSIAKQIIAAHRGEICVFSDSGQGTCFEILFLR